MKYHRVMPGRNLNKSYASDAYYHVYNRGVNRRRIFQDDEDYRVFLNLLKRYLSMTQQTDRMGRPYPWLHNELELLAFCLMPNHFHLFIYQHDSQAMRKLLQGVCTAYTVYFNRKYKRTGRLFENRYRATHILDDSYLQHISRYIHLNPHDFTTWQYSSYPYYVGTKKADWVNVSKIITLFSNQKEYTQFLRDYEGYKRMLDELKHDLADH